MYEQLIESFLGETREAFQFLEQTYQYHYLEGGVKYPDEGRDTIVQSKYVGSRVGIQIWWYFAEASMGVTFIELLQPGFFPTTSSSFPMARPDIAKAIRLYDLAEMLGKLDDPDFLLKESTKPRQRNKRAQFIETRRREIIFGLGRATQTYATAILQGDTSVFPAVMEYSLAKQKQLFPYLFIPGLKPQE